MKLRGVRPCLWLGLLSLGAAACGDDSGVRATSFGGMTSDTTSGGGSESSTGLVTSITTVGTTMESDSGTTTGGLDTTDDGTQVDESTGVAGEPCDDMDIPDINGLDENGDGIDGLLGCSVFVNQMVGSDLNDGTAIDDPVATIQRGIEISQTYDPPRMVLVAAGNYQETVNLNSGVSIYGGYDPDTWDRDVYGNVTQITGQGPRTIIAESLATFVELDGFTINAASYASGAQSTYAVWVRDIPDNLLQIDYCTINAGDAGNGSDGANGSNGEDGGHGGNATGTTPGPGGTSACNAIGGNGGAGQPCPASGGLSGQAGGDPTPVGDGGPPGASDCSGACNDEMPNGSPGLPGYAGINGSGSQTAIDVEGTFANDGFWVGPQGTNATRGHHGSGGGGGGAGGYDYDRGFFCSISGSGQDGGGGGGGGGAGGCGGEAGLAGQAGGGTFGVVGVLSSIAIRNSSINLGSGGNGGNGGSGGNGGVPGAGGNGANGAWSNGGEPGNGREGREGGGGGGGGGGQGGCGGASVGIARVDATSISINNVSFHGGTAGSGGTGGPGGIRADGLNLQAPAGQTGCQGFTADQADF